MHLNLRNRRSAKRAATVILIFAMGNVCAEAREAETVAKVETVPDVVEVDLRQHVEHLASDAMRGRDSLSPEAIVASQYIADQFKAAGVVPHGTDQSWFQPFDISVPELGKDNELSSLRAGVRTNFRVENDWNPFSVSPNKGAKGSLVFCGYGIHAPERQWDDFANIDVRGKVVLVFRKNPGWKETRHASFINKLQQAAKRGAVAVLVCNNPAFTRRPGKTASDKAEGKETEGKTTADNETKAATTNRDRLRHWRARLGAPKGSADIPYAFISQLVATSLLGKDGPTLKQLEKHLRAKGPKSFDVKDVEVRLKTSLIQSASKPTRNVVGLLPGSDPDLASEIIVLGAHYDHVGLGLYGSTGGPNATGKIHNGADDNASGVSALLELAQWFAVSENRPRRSLLLIAFAAEERGLLGSKHFVDHPTVDLRDIRLMVNMDMVGRCRENKLHVGGVGTAKGLKDLVAACNESHGLNITWNPSGVAPSDSTSFFRKRLSVLFFFTMLHKDYHRPTDDADLVNYKDMLRVVSLVRDTVSRVADQDDALEFTMPPRPPARAYMGIGPARDADERGIRVGNVLPGGPCGKAGMEAGDIITKIGGQTVRTMQDVQALLSQLKPGKEVDVVVVRADDSIKTLRVTLGRRR